MTQDTSINFFSAKITDVFSEAFDGRGERPERWFTQNPLGLGTLADGITTADHDLHRAVGMPLEDAAGAFGIKDATGEMAAGITVNMLLAPVDRQLAGMVRKVEIVGIAVGVAFGMHPLALACTKLFLRAQLNREIGNAMKGALFGRDENVVQGRKVVAEQTRPVDRSRAVEPMARGVDRTGRGRPSVPSGDANRDRLRTIPRTMDRQSRTARLRNADYSRGSPRPVKKAPREGRSTANHDHDATASRGERNQVTGQAGAGESRNGISAPTRGPIGPGQGEVAPRPEPARPHGRQSTGTSGPTTPRAAGQQRPWPSGRGIPGM